MPDPDAPPPSPLLRFWPPRGPLPGSGCVTSLTVALLIVGLIAAVLHANWHRIPPNALPWEPVQLAAKPGWLAHLQLNVLARDGAQCRAALTRAKIAFSAITDRKIAGDCDYFAAVNLTDEPVPFGAPPTACGLAAALHWYELGLQDAAQRTLRTRVVAIEHVGTFACRNVNSDVAGARSQHATANAIDVTAFRFADGRRITVTRDYGKPTPAGRFLDAAHDAACALFNGVLGPRYNRLHATHFHLDMGPYRICA